jgi:hypothetical protein
VCWVRQLAMHNEMSMPDDARRFVKQAMNSGRLLLSLINDILDITRIEAGQLELDQRSFQLKVLLEETVDLVRPKALDKAISLDLVVDEPIEDARLVGDMSRVQQVLHHSTCATTLALPTSYSEACYPLPPTPHFRLSTSYSLTCCSPTSTPSTLACRCSST